MEPPGPSMSIKEVYGGLLDAHPKKLQILRPVSDGTYEDV